MVNPTAYRRVLAVPKVGPVLLVALGDRLPKYAAVLALTLHCVQNLHRGYGAAGALLAVVTAGDLLAAPLVGRRVDRRGARPTVLLGGTVQCAFFLAVPHLDYRSLLAAGFVRAFAPVPTHRLARQSLTALVPAERLRTALALDSIGVEVAMMAGPALAVLAVTRTSGTTVFTTLAAALALSATGWYLTAPDLRAPAPEPGPAAPDRPRYGRHFPAVLLCAAATGLMLSGTDVGIVATTRALGHPGWAGPVITLWCAASLLGGFLHGAARRPPRLPALVLLLALTTLLAGALTPLATHWWTLTLTLLPAGLCCAPALTAAAEAAGRTPDPRSRGRAITLQNTALATGTALAGLATDHTGHPGWAYAAIALPGTAAALLTLTATATARRARRARPARSPENAPG
ncbi:MULTISPECIES: MFS transporter [Kitasatospora]|uniref:Putative major facilitator superfamily transporter n=1 Tax=Kitasatospora setae (strain ATCC 33774 / DSM 43861 / JCM 3304 / KCC A-0304 / NBRC 14216 / KM-6054) TaxID=452652 RepID=E4N7C8_KITSK|nr:MFS transporter [Kitasatospora setae]BAJ27109.1 putative major facilitator superfamily transporter [Kitasatospora setae KM-6054]